MKLTTNNVKEKVISINPDQSDSYSLILNITTYFVTTQQHVCYTLHPSLSSPADKKKSPNQDTFAPPANVGVVSSLIEECS